MSDQKKKNQKYKMIAQISKLSLNKKLNFQTKIIWKRNVNKTQTDVVLHENGESIYNQVIELELNLLLNHEEKKFQSKFTQFSIIVIYLGKIKSGGYIKFDAAQIVNKNYFNEKRRLRIQQCPDPQGFLDIMFNYELMEDAPRSLYNQLSTLNPLGMDLDLSQIDFEQNEKMCRRISLQNRNSGDNFINDINNSQNKEEKQMNLQQNNRDKKQDEQDDEKQNIQAFKEKQICKISNILDKFESITRKIKAKPSFFCKQDISQTKIDNLQISIIHTEQQEKYRLKILQLQKQLQNRDQLIEQYDKKLQQNKRIIQQLQIKLQLTLSRQIQREQRQRYHHLHHIQVALAESQAKYKDLYEQTLNQLEEIKNNLTGDNNFSKQGINFNKFAQQIDSVHQINQIPEFDQIEQCGSKQKDEMFEMLQRQNVQLQTKIASISHNIARIFNAAYEFGGAKLLDHLQNSIGLIQS